MRQRLRFVLLALAVWLAGGPILWIGSPGVAEPVGSHWELTPFGGFTIFDGKMRFPGSNLPVNDDLHVGARLGWQSPSWVGLEAATGFSSTAEDVPGGRDFDWLHASGNLVLSPARGRWGGPFVFAGAGWTQAKPAQGPKSDAGTMEFGGGLRLWISDNLGLRLEARDVSFKALSATAPSDHLNTMILGGGLVFALGGTPRDTDGDGVPDRRDKCPDTPRGAKVDVNGCPLDSDGDGVYDGIDQCPDTPAGLKVDATGCPIEVKERETELLDTGMIRLQNVNFETNKADILPESDPTLDAVGMLLTQWPQLKLEIGGHTDARGSAQHNQKLSETRAASVKSYLLAKFTKLSADQFTTRGYGESKPIAPNTNELGWAKNRRVEFVVLNRDVLKQEIERRRLLKQNEAAPDSTRR